MDNNFYSKLEKTLFKALIFDKLKTDRFNSVYNIEDFYTTNYITETDNFINNENTCIYCGGLEQINLASIILIHYGIHEHDFLANYTKNYKGVKVDAINVDIVINDLITQQVEHAKSIENDCIPTVSKKDKIELIKKEMKITDIDEALYLKVKSYDDNRFALNPKIFKSEFEKLKYFNQEK